MASLFSGSSGRRLILLIANLVLIALGVTLVVLGAVLLASYEFHHLTFASSLFLLTPILSIVSGVASLVAALYGLLLWKQKQEASSKLRLFSLVVLVAFTLSLVTTVMAFLLREVIAYHFASTDVTAQLRRFKSDPAMAARWTALQRAYACCGGSEEAGYRDWSGSTGRVEAVPDSCCVEEYEGCGARPFISEDAIPRVPDVIHTGGCVPAIKHALDAVGLPIMFAAALIALVAALIELLLMLCAWCFAGHVKKIKDEKSKYNISKLYAHTRETFWVNKENTLQRDSGARHFLMARKFEPKKLISVNIRNE